MVSKRRTKIIATLGPAVDTLEKMQNLLRAGVDIVRMNFSHGTVEAHRARFQLVRDAAKLVNREVGILADLQGPKIRIAKFKNQKVNLQPEQSFILDAALADDAGDEQRVGIDYKDLVGDVFVGDTLLLDDGRIILLVLDVKNNEIICRVKSGGELSNNKGINRLGGGLSAKALTEKDKQDLKIAIELKCDFIAISFPREAADMIEARELIRLAGGVDIGLIAKIERTEAVKNIDAIIHASDAIMVARGDLGVEIGDAQLPGVQKKLIHRARSLNKAVITATQMMESMIVNSMPTRAEVFDVANAVLDGTDAVMLSAETATGAHPVLVVEAMARICIGAEKERIARVSKHRIDSKFERIDEAIAMATMYTANHLPIRAIIALTESGSTPLWMSRIRSGIPIYALTRHASTRRRVMLYRGVYPISFDSTQETKDSINQSAVKTLQESGAIKEGDWIILTKGDLEGIHGGTNAMKIIKVGNAEI